MIDTNAGQHLAMTKGIIELTDSLKTLTLFRTSHIGGGYLKKRPWFSTKNIGISCLVFIIGHFIL